MFIFNSSLLKLLLLCVLLFWGTSGNAQAPRSNPERSASPKQAATTKESLQVIQDFLQSLRDHRIDNAYYSFTTKSFRDATSRAMFQQFIYGNSVLSKNQNSSFNDPVYQNDMIVFRGNLTSIDNNKNVVEFALTMEDGEWRILGIKVFP